MAFCSTCGSNISDDAKFCYNCGATVAKSESNKPTQFNEYQSTDSYASGMGAVPFGSSTAKTFDPLKEQPSTAFEAPAQNNSAPSRDPGAQNTSSAPVRNDSNNNVLQPPQNPIVKAVKSGLFLFALIAYGVSLLFSLINSLTPSALPASLTQMLYEIDPSITSIISNAMRSVNIGSSLIGILPGVMVFLSLLFFYLGCKNEKPKQSSLDAIRVYMIVIMVLLVLMIAVMFIALNVLIPAIIRNAGGDVAVSSSVMIGINVGLVIATFICIIPFMYLLTIVKTIKNIQHTIKTGTPVKFSSFLIVINWISAILGLVGALFSFNALGLLTNIASAAFLIILSLEMSKYNAAYNL